jgi:hypothetical protein
MVVSGTVPCDESNAAFDFEAGLAVLLRVFFSPDDQEGDCYYTVILPDSRAWQVGDTSIRSIRPLLPDENPFDRKPEENTDEQRP